MASDTITDYTLLITGVDATSGLVVGYRHVPSIRSGTLSQLASATWLPLKRILGYAYAEADGTLVIKVRRSRDGGSGRGSGGGTAQWQQRSSGSSSGGSGSSSGTTAQAQRQQQRQRLCSRLHADVAAVGGATRRLKTPLCPGCAFYAGGGECGQRRLLRSSGTRCHVGHGASPNSGSRDVECQSDNAAVPPQLAEGEAAAGACRATWCMIVFPATPLSLPPPHLLYSPPAFSSF